MIEIDKNSWHYKAALKAVDHRYDVPSNLCPYMRKVLLGCAQYLFLGLVGFVFGLWTLFSIGDTIGWLFAAMTTGMFGDMPEYAVTFWVIVGAVVAFVTIVVSYEEVYTPWAKRRKRAKGEQAPIQPGIFRLYMKAIHDKICPQLTFVKKEYTRR